MVCRQRFQSTLPRWERQKTQPKHVRDNRFQSTLPRGERPPSFPARSRCCRYFNPRSREGSDMPELRLTCGKKISIHAPARGATATASVGFARFVNFNPRSREGSDDTIVTPPVFFGHFNPRSREGSDKSSIPISAHIVPFQSTLPRGERRVVYIALKVVQNFNPRSREGSDDQLAKTIDDANKISIHAPARGATTMGGTSPICSGNFNPRSREGSDAG